MNGWVTKIRKKGEKGSRINIHYRIKGIKLIKCAKNGFCSEGKYYLCIKDMPDYERD
jgi:hypothetical protein